MRTNAVINFHSFISFFIYMTHTVTHMVKEQTQTNDERSPINDIDVVLSKMEDIVMLYTFDTYHFDGSPNDEIRGRHLTMSPCRLKTWKT